MIMEVQRMFGIVLELLEPSDLFLIIMVIADKYICRHNVHSFQVVVDIIL